MATPPNSATSQGPSILKPPWYEKDAQRKRNPHTTAFPDFQLSGCLRAGRHSNQSNLPSLPWGKRRRRIAAFQEFNTWWSQHSAMPRQRNGYSQPESSLGQMKYQPRIHQKTKVQRLQHHIERKVRVWWSAPKMEIASMTLYLCICNRNVICHVAK